MATELANKKAEREALRGVIQQWNANRLDLFELSEPNEVSILSYRRYLVFDTVWTVRMDRLRFRFLIKTEI